MNIKDFRKQYAQYDDLTDSELADKLHNSLFSDLPREHFDGAFLHSVPPDLEYTSNDVPADKNRLDFEVGLVKNKNTSKTAVLLPNGTTAQEAMVLAKEAKLLPINQDGTFYLFDPKQITERTLRNQIKAGKNGIPLGYGTDSVPEDGQPYAVDTDGHGTIIPHEIPALHQSGRLGFSGVAPSLDHAIAKIREMGRDDAEIRGLNQEKPLISEG